MHFFVNKVEKDTLLVYCLSDVPNVDSVHIKDPNLSVCVSSSLTRGQRALKWCQKSKNCSKVINKALMCSFCSFPPKTFVSTIPLLNAL